MIFWLAWLGWTLVCFIDREGEVRPPSSWGVRLIQSVFVGFCLSCVFTLLARFGMWLNDPSVTGN